MNRKELTEKYTAALKRQLEAGEYVVVYIDNQEYFMPDYYYVDFKSQPHYDFKDLVKAKLGPECSMRHFVDFLVSDHVLKHGGVAA